MRATAVPLAATCRLLARGRRVNGMARAGGEAVDRAVATQRTKPMVIIVTGPTAVGKTKVGLELAKRLNGEVISADSVQVYTGLDIGSDKLPEAQRQGIRHHLIDVLPPSADFSAGDFYELGRRAAEDILSRGKVPIVVGGTGFYLRWFMFGKPQTPPSNPEVLERATKLVQAAWARTAAEKAEAAAAAAAAADAAGPGDQQGTRGGEEAGSRGAGPGAAPEVGSEAWQRECAERRRAARAAAVAARAAAEDAKPLTDRNAPPDPPPGLTREELWKAASGVISDLGDAETAARVGAEKQNWYRLMRVCMILLQNGGRPLAELDIDTAKEADYDFRCFFLYRPRLLLYDKISRRVEEMVAGGLLTEAKSLLDNGLNPNTCSAGRAIGYRQALDFLRDVQRRRLAGEDAPTQQQLLELIKSISSATRRLVKAQHTWFRDDASFLWVDNTRSEEEVLKGILEELQRAEPQGGCGDSGRLEKEEARALREYQQRFTLFADPALVERVLGEVKGLWGNGGGSSGDGRAGAAAEAAAGGGAAPAAPGTAQPS